MDGQGSTSRALLAAGCIALDVQAAGGQEIFEAAAQLLHKVHKLRRAQLMDRLWTRERRGSTGIGWGVAIPHCDMPAMRRPLAAFVRAAAPVAFDAPDRAPTREFLILVAPRPATAEHFAMLSHYRQLLSHAGRRGELAGCADIPAVWRFFREHEWHGAQKAAGIMRPQAASHFL
ncbi:MAG TPA: PTS sugar transporter subunit IIA [Ramlibacter sp.]|nr:PTS sugar transporter subunit IIA [Ramlibacter sp.]